MSAPVVTRFAPSPTGYLHIGGARTALFNWLFAKANGGTMLLRIEDTDRSRSSQEAVDALLDGLTWLGLDWEGEPISQFSRVERHRKAVEQLLASGNAYRCYASQQELDDMRELARAEKRPPRYDGRWRDRPASDAPEGVTPVIRIKSPRDGETVVNDKVVTRPVEIGIKSGDLVEIKKGLGADAAVIAKAASFVRHGDIVRPVKQSTPRLSEVR